MITAVGAFVVYDHLADFKFRDWRSDIGLAAASSGSLYLIAWSQRHGNRRHRTVSIIGAIVGLVPIFAAIATAILFGGNSVVTLDRISEQARLFPIFSS